MSGQPLPPPTTSDMIDMAVYALNNVIVYEKANRDAGRPTLSDEAWVALVEADYQANTVQDMLDPSVWMGG